MRYFVEISYDGAQYHGWQRQENAVSVQQVVEEALSLILRAEITITGSGRTDTGVHCGQQYFHIDLENELDRPELLYKLNSLLPADISVNGLFPVDPAAHARFTALSRSYEYRITRRKDPFLKGYAYHFYKPLNVALMNEAASTLLGEHDFEALSKVKTDVDNFYCEISEAQWTLEGNILVFKVTANRFLRGMVRAMVGTLLEVGQGKLSVEQFRRVINSKDRRQAGSSAPAHGLFLTSVRYPGEIFVT